MSEMELPALLRELDDPERLERPLHYDRAATGVAFGGLVRRLEADFVAEMPGWFRLDCSAGQKRALYVARRRGEGPP